MFRVYRMSTPVFYVQYSVYSPLAQHFYISSKRSFMNRNEENKRTTNIPENNPSKPMDSKREVEKSPDNKTDQDFPGYPHYPANEDIMGQESGFHRVDANLEEMGTGPNATGVNQRFLAGQDRNHDQESVTPRAEGESDDLAAINSTNDEIGIPQNVSNEEMNSGEELPGSDLGDDESGDRQRS